jgi:hypothetical protein
MRTSLRAIKPLLVVASSVFLLASLTARADALHVSAASATSNGVYDLTFNPPGGSAAPLGITPLPASPKSSVRSIVYLPNDGTGVLDLIAADLTGSRIVRYAAATGSWSTVWAAPAAGPKSPEGLSVDSSGNLFVNRGDAGHPELWVLPRDPSKANGAAFLSPVLMDNTSFGTGSTTRLLETLVVRGATAAGLTPGDLLVLVNDGRVLRYSAASIKAFLNNGLANGPKPVPQTVVTTKQCPVGHTPTGMAMWPADSSIAGFSDSSLLVATIGGSVLRYQLTPTGSTPLPAFATGLGLSLGKIKTFTRLSGQNVVPYAVFDQPLRSKIFEFGSPPAGGCPNLKVVCNTPLATITAVSNPVGLAATDASTPSSACVTTDPNALGGCKLLGGGLQVSTNSGTAPNANASLLAESCIIVDPRVISLSQCDGRTLQVSAYCPGFPDTIIPAHLCAAGPGNTLAVIKVQETNPLTVAPNDLVVNMDVTAEALLGGPLPGAPQITAGWAPLASEVATNGGSGPADWSLHPEAEQDNIVNQFVELGSIYDAPASRTPGHSLVLMGVQLDPSHFSGDGTEAQLVTFADNKFASLLAILSPSGQNFSGGTTAITPAAKTDLTACVSKAQGYLDDTSGNLVKADRYACSARQVKTCDDGLNKNNFGPNTNQLSAYSTVDGRLLSLFTQIYSRLGLNSPPASLPLPTPVPSGRCDDSPPNAPTGLAATNVAQTSLTLTWQPAAANGVAVAGYNVFRNGTQVGTVGTCTNCAFPDSNLTASTSYHYNVQAYDTWNPVGKSPLSGTLDVTTLPPLDTQAPSTPDGLAFSYLPSGTGTLLKLSWNDSTDYPGGTGVGGYHVYLNGIEQAGSPTSNTYLQITLTTTNENDQFPATVSAYDKATPTPNVSMQSSPLLLSCYDDDIIPDNDCDSYP